MGGPQRRIMTPFLQRMGWFLMRLCMVLEIGEISTLCKCYAVHPCLVHVQNLPSLVDFLPPLLMSVFETILDNSMYELRTWIFVVLAGPEALLLKKSFDVRGSVEALPRDFIRLCARSCVLISFYE